MGLLQFERGVSTLGQQVGFARELGNLTDLARANGALDDPEIASRLARADIGLMVMRAHAQRTLDGDVTSQAGAASVSKLLWANWHRELGEIAEQLVLSSNTVSTYRARILEKTGWANNTELTKYCMQHGLTQA